MDATYTAYHDRVRDLRFAVKDALDEPDNPLARQLCDSVQRLEDELEQQKHPRNLEERIKAIMVLLEPARSGQNVYMSVGDAVTFHDRFEDMRRAVREHPDY